MECNEEKSQKQLCYEKCELAWEGIKSQECIDQFAVLVDDEELELRELQARKHIITSCDHFMTNGVNSCSLCKGEGRTWQYLSIALLDFPFNGIFKWKTEADNILEDFIPMVLNLQTCVILKIIESCRAPSSRAFWEKSLYILGFH